jgi:archaellum biogenesis protein FlaJ (TadC family)
MKIFIAFMLVFFTNCLMPATISATINAKTVIAHSVIAPVKKLSFKEKLLLKLSKKEEAKLSKFQRFLLIGILLLILGVILFYVSDQKSKAAPQGGFVPSFAGTGELLLGLVASGLGLIFILAGAIGAATKKDKAPKQVP